MEQSAEGDALGRLVSAHLGEALRFATRLTGDPEAGEEIVAEALARAARTWSRFRGESRFRTWLFQIVTNVFRDQIRGRKPAERLDDELMDERAGDPAGRIQAEELGRLVAAACRRQDSDSRCPQHSHRVAGGRAGAAYRQHIFTSQRVARNTD